MFKQAAPKFLKKLDEYLLVNYPIVWISKIHYVIWWGLLLHGFSALLGLLMPLNLIRSDNDGLWFTLITLVSFILSWFWGYRYIVFNTHKNFGVKKIKDAYINFILCFCCIAIFSSAGYFYVLVKKQRTANVVSSKVLLQDIYTLNALEPYVPSSYYNYSNSYDSTLKETIFNLRLHRDYDSYAPYYLSANYINNKYDDYERGEEKTKWVKPCANLQEAITKVNQHLAVCEKYNVIPYTLDVNATANYFFKYQNKGWIPISVENNFINNTQHYYKEDVKTTFRIIYEAKHETAFVFDKDFLWGIFYVVFTLSLLLILFKQINWQQYLLTGIGMALYPLIAFIISQILFKYHTEDCFVWFVFALFAASIVSLYFTLKENRVFKPFPNILNAVFLLLLTFVPMLVISYLHSKTNLFHYNDSQYLSSYQSASIAKEYTVNGIKHYLYDWNYYYREEVINYWVREYDKWFTIIKYSSIILTFALQPFFTNLFAKQLALPRKS